MRKNITLDAFDRRLLDLVRHNNLEPARVLAEKLGLSMSAVLRRLRRLREENVIVADVALVDPALTNSALTMHVLLKMRNASPRALDAFARTIATCPEVTAAWDVTGDEDVLLKVQVASMEDYDAFTRRVLDEGSNVASFKTLIAIRSIVENEASRRPLNF